MIPAFVSFLSGITLTLMHSIWQALLLWLVYISFSHAVRDAKSRFSVGLYLLVGQVLASVATFIYFTGTGLPSLGLASDPAGAMPTFFYVTNTLGAAYVLFQCFQLYKLHRSRTTLNGFICASQMTAPVQWRMYVREHTRKLNIRKRVRVYLSRTLQSPVTIGFFKPVILLPISMVNGLSPRQAEAVLLHELAHISRNDYIINVLLHTLQQMFFFNPFVVSILKACYRERENSCDDVVMQFSYDKLDYSRALLYLHEREMDWSMMALSNGSDYELLQRIRRIVADDKPAQTSFAFNWRLGSAVILSLMLATAPLLVQQRNENDNNSESFQRMGLYNYQKGYAWLRALHINSAEKFSWSASSNTKRALQQHPSRKPASSGETEGKSVPMSLSPMRMPELVLNMEPTQLAQPPVQLRILPTAAISGAAVEEPTFQQPGNEAHGRYYQSMMERVADSRRLSLDAKELEETDMEKQLDDEIKQAAEQIIYSRPDAEVLQSLITKLLELNTKVAANPMLTRKLGEDMIEAFSRTQLAKDILQENKCDYEDLMKHLRSLLVSRSVRL